MPVYCFVIGCRNGSRQNFEQCAGVGGGATINQTRARFFSTPKDEVLLKQWAQKLPQKQGTKLNASSRVCENHFVEQDIIKNDEMIIDGKVILLPRKNWKLKYDAVPSIFEDESTRNLLPTETPKRKTPVERKPLGNITNYREHCPSRLNPKKRKPAQNSKIELEYLSTS